MRKSISVAVLLLLLFSLPSAHSSAFPPTGELPGMRSEQVKECHTVTCNGTPATQAIRHEKCPWCGVVVTLRCGACLLERAWARETVRSRERERKWGDRGGDRGQPKPKEPLHRPNIS